MIDCQTVNHFIPQRMIVIPSYYTFIDYISFNCFLSLPYRINHCYCPAFSSAQNNSSLEPASIVSAKPGEQHTGLLYCTAAHSPLVPFLLTSVHHLAQLLLLRISINLISSRKHDLQPFRRLWSILINWLPWYSGSQTACGPSLPIEER